MIYIDENEPEGVLEPAFPPRDVKIKRNTDAEALYDMLHEVGRGKFGIVYKCKEKSTGLQLAAKFVPIPTKEDRRNVEREVEIMNSLQHHLIIQLYAAYEFQKNMCVVLELVEGGELFDRVVDKEFVLTEGACVVFMRQVCEAIDFIHKNNILHLDLKPENILCLTKEGNRIKVIDFGLARKFDPNKKLKVLFGTPEFVAPEVVNFDCISYATDMWSVGVICYVLISGLSPFLGEDDIATMANVTIAKYDFEDESFNNVSRECLDFISKFLVKDLNKRMTAAESLKHTWLQKRPKKQSQPPPLPQPQPLNIVHPAETTNANANANALTPPAPAQELPVSSTSTDLSNEKQQPLNELPSNELNLTKDNLRNLIERWDEQPSSPYIFDVESRVIAPQIANCSSGGNADSIASSATRELTADNHVQVPKVSSSGSNGGSGEGGTGEGSSAAKCEADRDPAKENLTMTQLVSDIAALESPEEQRKIAKYLHDSQRRNSDTNYLLGQRSATEPANLAEKINKLSEFLRMLSEINNSSSNNNNNDNNELRKTAAKVEPSKDYRTASRADAAVDAAAAATATATSSMGSAVKEAKCANAGKTSVLKLHASIEEMPKLRNGAAARATATAAATPRRSKHGSSALHDAKSKAKSEKSEKSEKSKKPPGSTSAGKCATTESASNRRSKFRVNQMSRDVPVGLPDTHRPVNLEEVANNTKDCILQLLEKYQDQQLRNPLGRHKSISVDCHVSDELGYRSLNSINAFFQRHANGGQFVRQMQAQFEEKTAKK